MCSTSAPSNPKNAERHTSTPPSGAPSPGRRAITQSTCHQMWWPAHDQPVYTDDRLPVWDSRARAFTNPDTGVPLPSWEQACEELTEPAHVVRFGEQVHVK